MSGHPSSEKVAAPRPSFGNGTLRTAYIGLGANLPSPAGDPAATLRAAFLVLGQLGTLAARSSLYRTAPVGLLDQPPFLNAAAALRTPLAPLDLLDGLLAIERAYGRDRSASPPKGPRTLDLDLLLLDDLVISTPHLTLPHPALHQRRFVLAPLAEIAPALRHPTLGHTMAELLAALPPGVQDPASVERLTD